MTNRPISSYPSPHVAVDIALLTVVPDDGLAVLVQRRDEAPKGSVLPGSFMRERETIEDTVARVLRDKVGVPTPPVAPRLLQVFSDPDRDERAWTISIAHAVTMRYDDLADARGRFVPIAGNGRIRTRLLFDHRLIVADAAARIREHYELSPDPHHLLPDEFTLTELRELHEAILGTPLRRDTFNRRMTDPGNARYVEGVFDGDVKVTTSRGPGRPAQLFRHARPRQQKAAEGAPRRLVLPRAAGPDREVSTS